MDSEIGIALLLIIILFLLVALMILPLIYFTNRTTKLFVGQIQKRNGKLIGGSLFAYPGLTISIDGNNIQFHMTNRHSRTTASVRLPSLEKYSMTVRPFPAIKKKLVEKGQAAPSLNTGNSEFDERFYVSADIPQLAYQCLTPEVQQNLLRLARNAPSLGCNEGHLYLTIDGHPGSESEFDAFIEIVIAIASSTKPTQELADFRSRPASDQGFESVTSQERKRSSLMVLITVIGSITIVTGLGIFWSIAHRGNPIVLTVGVVSAFLFLLVLIVPKLLFK
jgi:hypothetical protein